MCVGYMQILCHFYTRDLSICGFWYPWRSWNQSPQIPRDDCTLFEVISLKAEALEWMRVFKKRVQNKKRGPPGLRNLDSTLQEVRSQ